MFECVGVQSSSLNLGCVGSPFLRVSCSISKPLGLGTKGLG